MSTSVESFILQTIRRIMEDENLRCEEALSSKSRLSDDLGLSSMSLAEIVSELEDVIGFDPFTTEVSITDVVTVGDLIAAYASKH